MTSGECHETLWLQVNFGSRNSLVPSGIKLLPEPMLTKIYIAIWRQLAAMS